jgi:hypothetical protein
MFWVFKDVQTLVNKRKGVKENKLAQWVSLIFKKKSSPTILKKGLKQLTCTSQICNIMKFQSIPCENHKSICL